MFYLIINEEIRKYINMLKHRHFGCKYFCPLQLIALDEMELLRKELEKINVKLTNEEYLQLIKCAENKYYHNVHICNTPEEERKKEEEKERRRIMEELNKETIAKREENPFVNFKEFEMNYRLRKEQEEKNDRLFNPHKISSKTGGNFGSVTNGFSMIASFFLLVFGAYYLGKYFFGLSDANNYKLILVVTIVIFISETCLLLLKMHREDMKIQSSNMHKNGFDKYWQNSFAYKFNKNYRNQINKGYVGRYGNKNKIE